MCAFLFLHFITHVTSPIAPNSKVKVKKKIAIGTVMATIIPPAPAPAPAPA